MPNMCDPRFSQTLTYLCEHNAQGAMGLVVNRPLQIPLSTLLEQVAIPKGTPMPSDPPVYAGGPVQTDHGFILHRSAPGAFAATLQVTDEIGVTTSQDILQALAHGEGPTEFLVAIGYAGWGPGQLEQELAENAWLTVGADPDTLFRVPAAARLQAAADRLGVNLQLLAPEGGRA